MNLDANAAQAQNQEDSSDNELDRLEVFDINDKLLFELIGLKTVLTYAAPGEDEFDLVVYETSTGVDFVKVCAEKSTTGIQSEYAWVDFTYPGLVFLSQSLIEIKIYGEFYYCDLLRFRDNVTGEVKDIYFEISDFFGKW
ncbi:MAG: hypothetical protein LBI14_08205 [Treponema sp.]|jgi:hypothetical protein|nr:hypothetical protein [Treponema sp.]